MEPRKVYLIALALAVFAAFSALTAGGMVAVIGVVFAVIGALGATVFYKYGFVVFPTITSMLKKTAVTKSGFEIPPSQDVIMKKTKEGTYFAAMYLTFKLYQSAVESEETQLLTYNKMFERAMAGFNGTARINMVLNAVDITSKKQELETKKAEAQLHLQREREKAEPDPLRIERFEREVMYWNAQIDKLSKGLRPMRVVIYASVYDAGLTKEEALARVREQAIQLRTLLSNALNCEVYLLTADEMLRAFQWDQFIPVTMEEMEAQIEKEKSAASNL